MEQKTNVTVSRDLMVSLSNTLNKPYEEKKQTVPSGSWFGSTGSKLTVGVDPTYGLRVQLK